MNDVNFEKDLLDESPTEVIQPSLVPEGTYLAIVKLGEEGKFSTGTRYYEVPFQLAQAGGDVDDNALADALGDESLSDQTIYKRYSLTPKAIGMLDKLHYDCGIDLDTDGRTRRGRNEAIVNSEVWVYVKHNPSTKDPTKVYANVERTIRAE